MATHTELVSLPFNNGRSRFCLDRVARDEEDGRIEYALVWRGNLTSPDGFIQRPAYFTWEMVGQLLRRALRENALSREEWQELVAGFIDEGAFSLEGA